MPTEHSLLRVEQFCIDNQAVAPSDGERLADAILQTGGPVSVDFTGILVLGSSYANALFLKLRVGQSLDAALARVQFTGLRPSLAHVLEKSKVAVARVSEQAGR